MQDPSAFPETASQRLITQNLLVSAASHELQGKTNWKAIHDLSVFIDTFCLYDEIVVLGRQAYSMLPNRSDIISAAKEIIRIEEPFPNARVIGTACGHLGAYLNEEMSADKFQPLIESLRDYHSVALAFSTTPDGPDDFRQGEEWLRTVPEKSDILAALGRDKEFHRGVTFLVRTFLYLAYADIYRLAFTPDSTRARVLEPIAQSERKLRQMLLEKLKKEFQNHSFGNDINVRRHITPLASVVFDRAYPKLENIAREMVELRYDLAPIRERLRRVENKLADGTRKDELAVAREWGQVFQEIEKVYGFGEGLLSLQSTLAFAESAGEFVEKPVNPGTWAKILTLPAHMLRRMLNRWPVLEIHRVQFPSSEKLQNVVHRLFGDIANVPG